MAPHALITADDVLAVVLEPPATGAGGRLLSLSLPKTRFVRIDGVARQVSDVQ